MQYRIQKDDNIIVIAGKDKGKVAKVLRVINKCDKVLVEGANIVKRHTRPNPHTNQAGGIIEKEAPLHLSNIMPYCTSCNKGVRIGFRMEGNKKVRFCKKCNGIIQK